MAPDRQEVVALECATGKVRWRTDRKSNASRRFSFGTPLLIEVKGRRQIVSPASDQVAAYDPKTGEIWRVRTDGYSVIPRPVYGQGLVFIATGYDTPGLMAIRPDGQGDVTKTHIAWKTGRAPRTRLRRCWSARNSTSSPITARPVASTRRRASSTGRSG